MLTIFAFTTLAWYYFRLPTVAEANAVVGRIISLESMGIATLKHMFHLVKGLTVIGLLLLLDIGYTRIDIPVWVAARPARALMVLPLLVWLLAFLGTFDNNAFIYFQF